MNNVIAVQRSFSRKGIYANHMRKVSNSVQRIHEAIRKSLKIESGHGFLVPSLRERYLKKSCGYYPMNIGETYNIGSRFTPCNMT